MLASVPTERRSAPEFQKAVDKMAHLVAARRRWLHRLGHWPEAPEAFPHGRLEDAELARSLEWSMSDGKRFRWDVEGILSQTFGHAWYHRGQIAMLVGGL